MDCVDETQSAERFHDWAARAVNRRADQVRQTLAKLARGGSLAGADLLRTRYTLDGEEESAGQEEWPNFQLDGFGTWLWALEEHVRAKGGQLKPEWQSAAALVADYLCALWRVPCYDCWEEFPHSLHTHTLAAIYGGLRAYQEMGGNVAGQMDEIRTYLSHEAVRDGYFIKSIGRTDVDASSLGLAVPYGVVTPTDTAMLATVAHIETELRTNSGGVHRYQLDTYFGGGEWVLLTAWLGWYYLEAGQLEKARTLLALVEAQADANGYLPEQVPASLNDPSYYQVWVDRWGKIASPLLWSHANYLILRSKLRSR
jgi:GH15 family glucan-1,4-alpha-glucosidase